MSFEKIFDGPDGIQLVLNSRKYKPDKKSDFAAIVRCNGNFDKYANVFKNRKIENIPLTENQNDWLNSIQGSIDSLKGKLNK